MRPSKAPNETEWETATLDSTPLGGYCLEDATYRFTGTLGDTDTPPETVLLAYARLAEYMAAVDDENEKPWLRSESEGDYAAFSDILLECCLTEPYQATKVYYEVTHSTVDDARTAILCGINAGALIVNYVGHGATNLWAHEGLFKNTDVGGLTNGGKLPVILPMTCLDGYYIYPHVDTIYSALGEVVTRAEGKGAVASWSPTGLGVATGHKYLDQGFFDAVFRDLDGSLTLGQATTAGKLTLWASGSNLDLIDTYLLFGDPAMELTVVPAVEPVYLPIILRAAP